LRQGAQHLGEQALGVDAREGALAGLADGAGGADRVDDPGFSCHFSILGWGARRASGATGGAQRLLSATSTTRPSSSGVMAIWQLSRLLGRRSMAASSMPSSRSSGTPVAARQASST